MNFMILICCGKYDVFFGRFFFYVINNFICYTVYRINANLAHSLTWVSVHIRSLSSYFLFVQQLAAGDVMARPHNVPGLVGSDYRNNL